VPIDPIDGPARPQPIPERPARRELSWWQAVPIILVCIALGLLAARHLLLTLDRLVRAGML